ncbi:Uncharacterised protein [Yersinia frederiksenii]|uniref:Uncharacterized protein n=1 Tax=Yersinia frederiksenii TaxID=29484 RepID=A0A380PNF6_YERFR|nr:hypothetical protein [Yersinia frederiksenii]ATM96201.1 hypothetical protein CRN75_13040 [Yersinia frederiksenii]EEQ12891.1 Methyl-accepting chemotaxis protein [Yersinia frederiksenii ATCC 33641]SUP75108.1 Uncharacterised protein [Yersinia frederiksenii]
MLESYFGIDYTDEQKKRLLAVQAALEVIQTSVSASTAYQGVSKVKIEVQHASDEVGKLADAIQAALGK